MKNKIFLLIIILVFITSCKDDYNGFAYYRRYLPNAFSTYAGGDLRTAGLRDTLVIGEDGKPVASPYWAMIKGEFTDIEDTIVQFGHVWSLDNPTPYIDENDTTTYSRKIGYKDYNGDGKPDNSICNIAVIDTFITVIPNLMPETSFYVRSYIITINGDTGYNKTVFVDTTISPLNEWFRKSDYAMNVGMPRVGAASFTMYNEEKGYECAYVFAGGENSNLYNDFFEYDPKTDTWSELNSMNAIKRKEAVALSISFYDKYGIKQIMGYAGLGRDMANNKLDDWWAYYPKQNRWDKSNNNFKMKIAGAVSFVIDEKAYIGTGFTGNSTMDIAIADFYSYNPKADSTSGIPWTRVTKFADNEDLRRGNAVAFVIDDKAYVGTGVGPNNQYYKDLWLFIPPNENSQIFGTWISKTNLPDTISARSQAVAFVIENQGYIGMGFDGNKSLQDLWRYDPYNDSWTKCADYKTGPDYVEGESKYIRGAIGFGIEDKGYVGLGYKSENDYPKYSCELWVYRPW